MKEELISNRQATVGTSSSKISEKCFQQRSVITISNISTAGQVVYISFGTEAAVGYGIPLSVGGWYCESMDNGYKPSNEQVNAIASAVGATISIQERIIMDTFRG